MSTSDACIICDFFMLELGVHVFAKATRSITRVVPVGLLFRRRLSVLSCKVIDVWAEARHEAAQWAKQALQIYRTTIPDEL
jgi:hypothetical protein